MYSKYVYLLQNMYVCAPICISCEMHGVLRYQLTTKITTKKKTTVLLSKAAL